MRFIFTILFSNLLLLVTAQNISGKIQGKNNNALAKALLFIENNGSSFYTNSDGEFSIPTQDIDITNLVIFKEDYKEYRIELSKQDYTTFLNITLTKLSLNK